MEYRKAVDTFNSVALFAHTNVLPSIIKDAQTVESKRLELLQNIIQQHMTIASDMAQRVKFPDTAASLALVNTKLAAHLIRGVLPGPVPVEFVEPIFAPIVLPAAPKVAESGFFSSWFAPSKPAEAVKEPLARGFTGKGIVQCERIFIIFY